ncbi:MAG: DUF3343 domain-containing protein [Oscillospiraceae bacterium]|nr:DUF3343 domain-containing protein [Oscillospiraceae bacterium]
MKSYMIVTLSTTMAFKAKRLLNQNSVACKVVKTPIKYTTAGCSHSLIVSERDITAAKQILGDKFGIKTIVEV